MTVTGTGSPASNAASRAGAAAHPSSRSADGYSAPPGRSFAPARWLNGPHLQTIVPALFRAASRLPRCRRERLELPDGDFIDLDIVEPAQPARGYGLIVHGLEGSSRSPYAIGTAGLLVEGGLVAVALNQRGCSGEANRLPGSYHSGLTSDIRAAVAWIEGRYPALQGGLVGFSLGANQTLKMLGEAGSATPPSLVGACAISPPFDLHAVADRLDSPGGALYRYHFLRTLVPKALAKAGRFPAALDRRTVLRAASRRSLRAFDDLVTGPVHGFSGAADYYEQSGCGRFVAEIRLPTLILTATDDPIIPGATIPAAALAGNPAIEVHAASAGGHVGFVYGAPWRPRYWAEEEAVRWLSRRVRGEGAGA